MRYAILTFLWAVALVAYVQRSAISVPLQQIGQDLAVQETWFGDATRALGFLPRNMPWYSRLFRNRQ